MRPYAGYSIDFSAFWKFYKSTTRADYSQYRSSFVRCFCASEKKFGLSEGYGSNHVNLVGDHLTQICSYTRTAMLSNGVPEAAVKNIIARFKKWFISYYA